MTDGVNVDKLNMNGLIEYHNTLNPKNPVKQFKNVAEGRKVVKGILDSKSPIDLDKRRKEQQMNATAEVKDAKPATNPEAKDKPKKPVKPPREVQDMSKDGMTLASAHNRKEVALFHALNKAGLGAEWDAKAEIWMKKNNKPREEAPGNDFRIKLHAFGTSKRWPSKTEIKDVVDGLRESLTKIA